MSHISPDFIPVFGDAIRMTREVLFTKDAQPFLIAGSGTLGWDQVCVAFTLVSACRRRVFSSSPAYGKVSANLIEPGENALVLNSGYFGDSFADWCAIHSGLYAPTGVLFIFFDSLRTYGANVDQVAAPFGAAVALSDLESALQAKKYKLVTFTHVDTSTGTLARACVQNEMLIDTFP